MTEQEINSLLREFQRACEAVVVEGDAKISETSKVRAILRNDLRARLLASRSPCQQDVPDASSPALEAAFLAGASFVAGDDSHGASVFEAAATFASRSPVALSESPTLSEDERAFVEHLRGEGLETFDDWSPDISADELLRILAIIDRIAPPSVLEDTKGRQDGVALIAAERKRQVESPTGDDDARLTDGQLADSAALMLDTARGNRSMDNVGYPLLCAYKLSERHAKNPLRLLAIAGAFVAAEIDRLNRASDPKRQESIKNG